MSEPRIGLVLGAGGARGFCHVGVLQVLTEHNIPIDIIGGASMGSLVGGAFCAGITLNEMESLAGEINQAFVMDFSASPNKKLAILKGERVTKLIISLLGEKKIEDLSIEYLAVACDLNTGKTHVFKKGLLWQAVRASIAIPMVFKPVEFKDMLLTDG
ncbi:MAG: patatin-like phospholipase family protein, partial [Clostridiales bacterium]|nr:patatin-like phospholipase family protein [Clostridiales bacterium]